MHRVVAVVVWLLAITAFILLIWQARQPDAFSGTEWALFGFMGTGCLVLALVAWQVWRR